MRYGVIVTNWSGTFDVIEKYTPNTTAATITRRPSAAARRRSRASARNPSTIATKRISARTESELAQLQGIGETEKTGTHRKARRHPVAEDQGGEPDEPTTTGLPFLVTAGALEHEVGACEA